MLSTQQLDMYTNMTSVFIVVFVENGFLLIILWDLNLKNPLKRFEIFE